MQKKQICKTKTQTKKAKRNYKRKTEVNRKREGPEFSQAAATSSIFDTDAMGLFRDYGLSRRGVELRGYRAVWQSPGLVVVVVVYGGIEGTNTNKKKPQIKKRKTKIKKGKRK